MIAQSWISGKLLFEPGFRYTIHHDMGFVPQYRDVTVYVGDEVMHRSKYALEATEKFIRIRFGFGIGRLPGEGYVTITRKEKTMTEGIDKTLDERGKNYGRFEDHAKIAQNLKAVMQGTFGWGNLASDQKEALEMIAHKIARILNGNPDLKDSWHDIVGYAKLVDDRLGGTSR